MAPGWMGTPASRAAAVLLAVLCGALQGAGANESASCAGPSLELEDDVQSLLQVRHQQPSQAMAAKALEEAPLFKAARIGSCKQKLGYGSIDAPAKGCREMGGKYLGKPQDGDVVNCFLDWCIDGQLSPTKRGSCKRKVSEGKLRVQDAAACATLGGKLEGKPHPVSGRVSCIVDWCKDGTFLGTASGAGAQLRAKGAVNATISAHARECKLLGGMSRPASGDEFVSCNLDWIPL